MANDLISYMASIGMFYCSTRCIYVYKNVIDSISSIDEIFYLLDLLVNSISSCFVKCKLHIDNIQFFSFLMVYSSACERYWRKSRTGDKWYDFRWTDNFSSQYIKVDRNKNVFRLRLEPNPSKLYWIFHIYLHSSLIEIIGHYLTSR